MDSLGLSSDVLCRAASRVAGEARDSGTRMSPLPATRMVTKAAPGVRWSRFAGDGGEHEFFFAIESDSAGSFQDQLRSAKERYRGALADAHLTPESAVFRRIFISDAVNQSPLLREFPIADEPGNATAQSVVGQSPLGGGKVSMLAYHLAGLGRVAKRRVGPNHLLIEHGATRHLWSTQLCAHASDRRSGADEQTKGGFDNLIRTLRGLGANLKDNCVRTWLYVKDIDVFYPDVVEARRDVFEVEGLTADTHYIASTGIEGACGHRFDLVTMDAYSLLDPKRGQITFLNDFSRLCPTNKYGVTFERATRVAFSDRAHCFISGTAAIDAAGQVVHRGDVMAQLEYALSNVEALLRAGNSCLDDMMYLLVYLRDPSDYLSVNRYLRGRLPHLPAIIVQGAVCRPEWLVEIEGQAIAPSRDATMPQF